LFNQLVLAPELVGLVVATADIIAGFETLSMGQELWTFAEMPFARESGSVALVLKYFGNRQGLWVESFLGADHVSHDPLGPSQTARVGTGEQGHPRGGADGRAGVKTGQSDAFFSEIVQNRSFNLGVAITTKVLIAQIIHHNQHDVRQFIRGEDGLGDCKNGQKGGEEAGVDHDKLILARQTV
jgi:hypothetical protein